VHLPHSNARPAFTLIELLTVIAIIAILSGIVLVSLRGVRQYADKARCAGNLRQIYSAMMMFAQEHNDCLPTFTYNRPPAGVQTSTADTAGNPTLNIHLSLYAYAYPSVVGNGKLLEEMWGITPRDLSIFACPSDPRPMGQPEVGLACQSYAWNREIIISGLTGTPLSTIQGAPFIAGDSPQSTAQVWANRENLWPNRHGGSSPYQVTVPPTDRNDPEKNPRGENNLLFLDGHVESRTTDKIPTSDTTREGKFFWGTSS